jgi:hypothetical protein
MALFTTISKSFQALQHVPFNIVNSLISILVMLIGIASAIIFPFWLSIIIISLILALIIITLWLKFPVLKFPVLKRLPAPVSRMLLSLAIIGIPMVILWAPMTNKYLKEYPPPSVVYVVPGFWSPSPSGRWRMMIRHCGSEPLYNVSVGFTDADRVAQMQEYGRTHGSIRPEDVAQIFYPPLNFPEIDPTQPEGMFWWTPLNPGDEHYRVSVVSRDGVFDETLQIARRSGKYFYRIKVSKMTNERRHTIINCRDEGFPEPITKHLPACFPHYVADPHQATCR